MRDERAFSGNGKTGSAAAPYDPAPAGVPPEPEGLTLRDYISVLWRRKWVILLVVAVATVSAWVFSAQQTPMYQATATMFYKQQIDLANPLGGAWTSREQIAGEMATINDIMAGPEIQRSAEAILQGVDVDTSAGYTVTAEQQAAASAGSNSVGSNVVAVTGDSADAGLAAAAANAYVAAFIEWDARQWRTQIDKALPALQEQLAKYQGEASKLTADYVMLKQRIQDLQILRATTTGSYRALMPASVPPAPYAPNPFRSAILGFGVGLFAGIGLAFLLEQFDTRVRRVDDVTRALRVPVLGRIPRISRREVAEHALVTLTHPDGHEAEAFRLIRTNLEFLAVDSDVRTIVLTSPSKGDGKSLTVANLGVSLAAAGKKVIIVDADMRRPRQHKIFKLENEQGLSTVLTGKDALAQSLVAVAVTPAQTASGEPFDEWARATDAMQRLYVLPSGPIPPNPGELAASRRLSMVLEELSGEADIVLVDSPAMLAVGDTAALAARCDGVLFLVNMDTVRKPQLSAAADQVHRLPTRLLGIVLRTHTRRSGYYYAPYYYYNYTYTEDGQRSGKERRRRSGGRRSSDGTPATARVVAVPAASVAVAAAVPLAGPAPEPLGAADRLGRTDASTLTIDVPEFDVTGRVAASSADAAAATESGPDEPQAASVPLEPSVEGLPSAQPSPEPDGDD